MELGDKVKKHTNEEALEKLHKLVERLNQLRGIFQEPQEVEYYQHFRTFSDKMLDKLHTKMLLFKQELLDDEMLRKQAVKTKQKTLMLIAEANCVSVLAYQIPDSALLEIKGKKTQS